MFDQRQQFPAKFKIEKSLSPRSSLPLRNEKVKPSASVLSASFTKKDNPCLILKRNKMFLGEEIFPLEVSLFRREAKRI